PWGSAGGFAGVLFRPVARTFLQGRRERTTRRRPAGNTRPRRQVSRRLTLHLLTCLFFVWTVCLSRWAIQALVPAVVAVPWLGAAAVLGVLVSWIFCPLYESKVSLTTCRRHFLAGRV